MRSWDAVAFDSKLSSSLPASIRDSLEMPDVYYVPETFGPAARTLKMDVCRLARTTPMRTVAKWLGLTEQRAWELSGMSAVALSNARNKARETLEARKIAKDSFWQCTACGSIMGERSTLVGFVRHLSNEQVAIELTLERDCASCDDEVDAFDLTITRLPPYPIRQHLETCPHIADGSSVSGSTDTWVSRSTAKSDRRKSGAGGMIRNSRFSAMITCGCGWKCELYTTIVITDGGMRNGTLEHRVVST